VGAVALRVLQFDFLIFVQGYGGERITALGN